MSSRKRLEHMLALHVRTIGVLRNAQAGWPAHREAIFVYTAVLLAQRGLLRGEEVVNLKHIEAWVEEYKLSDGSSRKVLLLYLQSRKTAPRKRKLSAAVERKEQNKVTGKAKEARIDAADISSLRAKWKTGSGTSVRGHCSHQS